MNRISCTDSVGGQWLSGTAITALHVLEKVGFHGIIMDIVESAVVRSRQLGQIE